MTDLSEGKSTAHSSIGDLADMMPRLGANHVAINQILTGLPSDSNDIPPATTGMLIDYVIAHFHNAHRQELPELFRLARMVETFHADHPAVPKGLVDLVSELQNDLNSHMRKEEEAFFPLLKQGAALSAAHSVAKLRREHETQNQLLRRMNKMTNGFTAPDDACQSWRALYHGLAKFTDDFAKHVQLENVMLFAQVDRIAPVVAERSSCCGSCG